MTVENKHRADNKTLREFYEATGSKGVLWIDDRTGRIVELPVESRIRRGEGGCQLCHEQLVGMEKHGRVDFDERNLPRLVFGPGEAICVECVEWVRLLDYHAENGSVATSRFEEGDLVLRTGTEELYEVLEARLTGISTAGVWFPTYTCQRIEIRQGTDKILPACMGLLFEIPDCELQPVPPRYKLPASRTLGLKDRRKSVDLVGAVRDRLAITSDVRKRPSPTLPEPRRPLLVGKRGGP
jgi:hypothetical protein